MHYTGIRNTGISRTEIPTEYSKVHFLLIECTESRQAMSTKVTIQDIANELQLSRNTVSKAINNTGVLADATREKILRKAAELG